MNKHDGEKDRFVLSSTHYRNSSTRFFLYCSFIIIVMRTA